MGSFPIKIKGYKFGSKVVLTRERWSHILARHGKLDGLKDKVLRTVEEPDEVIQQSGREDTFHYFREEDKLEYNQYVCVVVNVEKGFIVTAYPTSRKEA